MTEVSIQRFPTCHFSHHLCSEASGGVVAQASVGHVLAESRLAHLISKGMEDLQQHRLAQVFNMRQAGHLGQESTNKGVN